LNNVQKQKIVEKHKSKSLSNFGLLQQFYLIFTGQIVAFKHLFNFQEIGKHYTGSSKICFK